MLQPTNAMSLLVPEEGEALLKKLTRACKKCGVELERLEGRSRQAKIELRKVSDSLSPDGWSWREFVFWIDLDRYTLSGFPGLQGYEFLCRIEHTVAGNIVSGPEAIDDWREATPSCDHCNTLRRRNDTFVLRHSETGRVVRVGRNCLADFLRTDPTQLVKYSELCRMLTDDDGEGFGCGGCWSPETATFLACAIASIELSGFHRSDSECPTKLDATFLASPCPIGQAAKAWEDGQPNAHHHRKAEKVLEWLRNDCAESNNDYLTNLHVVSQLHSVSNRHAGLMASAPVAWAREKEIELQRQNEREALPESHWFGEVKSKVEFTGTLLRTRDIESMYGSKTLYVFRTDKGSDVVWWCTGRRPLRAEQEWGNHIVAGDRVKVRGTVKSHDTYQGRKQTTIQRANVVFLFHHDDE